MVRRALAQTTKLAAEFPLRPEAMPPALTGSVHSKSSFATLLGSIHGLKLPFRLVRSG